ncbi:DUF1440 domain-containing protein [Lactococcus taiwanensis]|uniref:DUF1440 domain-containing protein n=1 Tax=Lactococcus taiwanensis TaxID=1151742 RepID=A0AA45KGA9_9LACT|nr:DUF1440 domain-containing protein [Lactococcus taiwanensis]QSE76501.1 DUF1440 domain-containing protein [Lactococcus taiwanensis]
MLLVTMLDGPVSQIVFKSLWFGILSGMVSGMVKIGWEALLPPRTLERDSTNPPQRLMEQMGVPKSLTHAFIFYSRNQKVYWFSLILHFSFSIFFAFLFILVGQFWPLIGLWQGMAYGLLIWIIWHLLLLPLLRTVPPAWQQPFAEHFSECFGHIVWAWTIAACAYYLISKDTSGILCTL